LEEDSESFHHRNRFVPQRPLPRKLHKITPLQHFPSGATFSQLIALPTSAAYSPGLGLKDDGTVS
jgi:hypothetical protein